MGDRRCKDCFASPFTRALLRKRREESIMKGLAVLPLCLLATLPVATCFVPAMPVGFAMRGVSSVMATSPIPGVGRGSGTRACQHRGSTCAVLSMSMGGAKAGDKVSLHYVGTLEDGIVLFARARAYAHAYVK